MNELNGDKSKRRANNVYVKNRKTMVDGNDDDINDLLDGDVDEDDDQDQF